jgi:hypothetical protein
VRTSGLCRGWAPAWCWRADRAPSGASDGCGRAARLACLPLRLASSAQLAILSD